jgi:DNA-binding beta-propeller fold protein YncE
MFRLHSRDGSGGRRHLWLGLATAVAFLVAAAPAQATPFVYVTNGGSDDISQYNVGAGGLLAPLIPPTVAATDPGGGVVVSPDGKSVYVTAGFGNSGSVLQYDVGPGGTLSPKSPATVGAGDLPTGVAVSPNGKSVYVANNFDPFEDPPFSPSVSQYDVGPDGALSPKSPPTLPSENCFPLQVAVSPDGKSVYVAGGDNNCVSQWDVGSAGKLSPKSPPIVNTDHAVTGVAVSPDGKSVYLANIDGDSVSQYDTGPGGTLTPKSPPTAPAGAGPFGVAVRPPPTTRGQCSHGGWKQFGFKSQGQCTSLVKRASGK